MPPSFERGHNIMVCPPFHRRVVLYKMMSSAAELSDKITNYSKHFKTIPPLLLFSPSLNRATFKQ